MKALAGREVEVPGVDGPLGGHLVGPAGPEPAPAVIVLPEVDGMNGGTVAAARRLSAAGYVALALDLYRPFGGAPPLADAGDTEAWTRQLDDRRQVSDLAVALAWLRGRPSVDPERTGAVGFSIGGRYATLLASEPHGLGAVVSFYSRPWPRADRSAPKLSPGDYTDRLEAPVCAIFGSEDEMIPVDMVARFDGLLGRHPELGHEVHLLAGRHYFTNESRPRRFRADSAEEAWSIATSFLGRHL